MKRGGGMAVFSKAENPLRGMRRRGAVLMEVILALVLFVGAAAIVTGGMNAGLQTLNRTQLRMHASDLAVSVLAELQMGLRAAATGGPEPFSAPYEEWTWELIVTEQPLSDAEAGLSSDGNPGADPESAAWVQAEVVIRHGFESIVHRLTQVLPVVPLVEPAISMATGDEAGGNGLEEELP